MYCIGMDKCKYYIELVGGIGFEEDNIILLSGEVLHITLAEYKISNGRRECLITYLSLKRIIS